MFNSSPLVTGFCIVYGFFADRLWEMINYYNIHVPGDEWIYKLNPLYVNSYLIKLISNTVNNTFDQPVQSEFFITLAANIAYVLIFFLIAILIFRRRDISLAS